MPGDLSGTDLAIQAYWSTEAGAVGLEDLGVKPDHALKHGNQHVRLIMAQKFDMPELTQVAIPAVSKRDNMREHMNCPIRLPSNIVKEAYKDTADGGDGGDDPFMQLRVMREHPVVRRALGEGVLASKIAVSSLYWDGVAYTKKDTFVAFYFNLLRTNKIHLICLVRKKRFVWLWVQGVVFVLPDFSHGSFRPTRQRGGRRGANRVSILKGRLACLYGHRGTSPMVSAGKLLNTAGLLISIWVRFDLFCI